MKFPDTLAVTRLCERASALLLINSKSNGLYTRKIVVRSPWSGAQKEGRWGDFAQIAREIAEAYLAKYFNFAAEQKGF